MIDPLAHVDIETLAAALDADAAMARATQATGLTDFGSVAEPLRVLISSVKAEGAFHKMGYAGLTVEIDRYLVNWLRFRDAIDKHPEVLDEDVSDPIVVVGLPRSGTTLLQRVLSQHSSTQRLDLWRTFYPAPFPDAPAEGPDPRIAVTAAQIEQMIAMYPDYPAMHPMAAQEPEECVYLMQNTLETPVFTHLLRVPSYQAWVEARGDKNTYENHRQMLQYLQWQEGPRRGPWVLKTPFHLARLDVLLETFPGATVVHTHRDPRTSIASLCRIIEAARSMRSDDIDRHEVGQFILGYWSEQWRRNLAHREKLGAGNHILDVQYDRVTADAVGVARGVFERRGIEVTAADEAAMADWRSENPQHKFGRIEYSLDQYDLTEEMIEEAFSDYYETFFGEGSGDVQWL